MAIRVNGTIVFANDRAMENIVSSEVGTTYTSLTPIVRGFTNTIISFESPIQRHSLTANRSFSFSSGGTGKTTVLMLDTGAGSFTPTFTAPFGGAVQWPEDTPPNFDNFRYWVISFVHFNTTDIVANAAGYVSIT